MRGLSLRGGEKEGRREKEGENGEGGERGEGERIC